MRSQSSLSRPGILAALAAAVLFGAGTPLAKWLLHAFNPWLLAGMLYLGSGCGLWLVRQVLRAKPVRPSRDQLPWLAGAILAGGVIAPVLLMLGLRAMPAASAALLLNAEAVFTALLAWCVFRENTNRRVALGMLAIVAGAIVLSWPGQVEFPGGASILAILGACLAWGIDNNLTRKVALLDATWLASIKGLVAGSVNLVLAFAAGAHVPRPLDLAAAMLVGFLAYGVSLVLFVIGLRHLGTARTSAYFSAAPFFGAALAVAMGDAASPALLVAGALMAVGLWLHVTEQHGHTHSHDLLEHEHQHVHDEHHSHAHDAPVAPGIAHRHRHVHLPMTHSHAHFPDVHHQHEH